ncbi:MAG: LexA family protein, partial [Pseudanabaena sp.]
VNIGQIRKPCTESPIRLPLFSSRVSAGFPSPADDLLESHLDLNRYLISQPAATFFMRFEGEPMLESGLQQGDLLIVDRSIEVTEQKIVVASVNGDLVIRRVSRNRRRLQLLSENPNCQLISITEDTEFQIWGVVTYVIRALLSSRRLQ